MNLGPNTVASTYEYVLNQSGNSPITLGNNSGVNWGAAGVVVTTGNQNISGIKNFAGAVNISGAVSAGNVLGLNNNFGNNATTNNFGGTASSNFFGVYGLTNYFGQFSSLNNYFGFYGSNNDFGGFGTINQFGSGSPNNIYFNGRFEGPIRLRLPLFSGLSNQAGQQGEIRISGNGLYICTGVSSGWNRIFLNTF